MVNKSDGITNELYHIDPEPLNTMSNPSLNGTLLYIFQHEKISKIKVFTKKENTPPQRNTKGVKFFFFTNWGLERNEQHTWELN